MVEVGSHLSHAAAGLNHSLRLNRITLAQFFDTEKTDLNAFDQLTLLFGAASDLQIAFNDLPDTCGDLLENPFRLLHSVHCFGGGQVSVLNGLHRMADLGVHLQRTTPWHD